MVQGDDIGNGYSTRAQNRWIGATLHWMRGIGHAISIRAASVDAACELQHVTPPNIYMTSPDI